MAWSRVGLLVLLLVPSLSPAQPAPPPVPPVPPPAPAAPPPPDPAVLEEAKRHFAQGVALYNDGNFNAALAEFEAAYRVRPSPGVLYNIGLTQKGLFRYNDAIASLEQFAATESKLTTERKAEVEQLIAEMKALLATVTIAVKPDGAAVLLDGRTIGVTPLVYGVAAGQHVVEVQADGYRPLRKELMITAGVPLSLEQPLAIIPRSAKVKIALQQPMAQLTIDGKPYGVVPIGSSGSVEVELPAGGHQVEVTAPGFETYRTELVVEAGNDRAVAVELVRPPRKRRVYEQWYFWTPIVLVIAGSVAAGLAVGLSSTQGPLRGSLDPGAQRVN